MPVITTFASLSSKGFTGEAPIVTSESWYSAMSVKLGQSNSGGVANRTKFVNDELWNYGSENQASPSTFRPYAVKYDVDTGLLSSYKVFPNLTFPFQFTSMKGVEKDSSGNLLIVTNNFKLIKYNSSNVYVASATFNEPSGIGSVSDMVKDSSDYLYVLSYTNTYFILTKVNPATFAPMFAQKVNLTINDCNLYTNGTNIYVQTYTSSTSTNTIFKFDNTGVITMQYNTTTFASSLKNCFAVDSLDNTYFLNPSTSGSVVKLDSAGNQLFVYTYSAIISGSYQSLALNSDGDIVLLQNRPAGATSYYYTIVLDSNTGGVLYASSISCQATFVLSYMVSYNGYLYITGTNNNYVDKTILKVSNNNNQAFTTPFSYSFTLDNGTVVNKTGTIVIASATAPSVSSGSANFTTTAYSQAGVVISTVSYTQSLGSTVPFQYAVALI